MDLLFPFLGMLLDLADAAAAALGLVVFWRTWLRPRRVAPSPAAVAGGTVELDRFLDAARRFGGRP